MAKLNAAPELLAARLALLALRATIHQLTPLDSDRVRLDSEESLLSTNAAAERLASKSKPIICDAEASDRTLIVHCRPPSEDEATEVAIADQDEEERGGFMPYLAQLYGPGDHPVMAFGRGESLLVPLSILDRWWREYDLCSIKLTGREAANLLEESAIDEARDRGAKGLLRFTAVEGSHVAFVCCVILDHQEDLPQLSDEQLVEMARGYRLILRTIVEKDASQEDPLHDSALADELRNAVEKQRAGVIRMWNLLKRAFSSRPIPPEVAAFDHECEKYFGPRQ